MTDRDRHPQQTFKGVRVTFTATQSCSAPPEKVFPLLCPIREYEYIPAWECDVVYLGSGFAENGGVFTTKLPGDGEGKDLWVISRYEPNHMVEFVRVSEMRAMLYRIELQRTEEGGTSVAWEQVLTGLSEKGNHHVKNLRQSDFTAMIGQVEKWMQHYLETGMMMTQ